MIDDDLAYKLPGDNLMIGELCREMGEVEENYIETFKTFKHEPSYRNAEPDLATSGERLQEWYQSLDQEFEAVIREFSDDELNTKEIDRGNGFKLSTCPTRKTRVIVREKGSGEVVGSGIAKPQE